MYKKKSFFFTSWLLCHSLLQPVEVIRKLLLETEMTKLRQVIRTQ